MLVETLLYTVLCWGILERAQGIQVAMATQREAHLSIFQDLGDQFFHCSLFFQNGKRISAICSNYGVMIDGETYETLEYLLTSLNTHIRIAMSKANCYFHLRVP